MVKRCALLILVLLLAGMLSGCRQTNTLDGTYEAQNPPVESGELVIKEITFDGKQLTMTSGDVQQTVDYRIEDGKLTLLTDYGDFTYDFEQKDEQTLTIDALDYVRK